MASSASALSSFERAFLARFFEGVKGFYLSGGAALGLQFGHRRSKDLDLFTVEEAAFRAATASMPVIAQSLGARVEVLVDAPAFRRLLLSGPGEETVRVDLVRETAERVGPPPRVSEGMVLDPPEEILANKICALLGRSEPRDLVDLFVLDRAGHRVLDALEAARRKDGGLTPAALAWAIQQVRLEALPEGLLAPLSLEELRAFAARLRGELEILSRRESSREAGPSR